MAINKVSSEKLITVTDLTTVIRKSIDSESMKEEIARGMAEHVLNFFGYSDRIIDNVLEKEDRDAFYMLEDSGLLTTQREETTLYDGRVWRIHYWIFRKRRFFNMLDGNEEFIEEDAQEAVYNDVHDDVWNSEVREQVAKGEDLEELLKKRREEEKAEEEAFNAQFKRKKQLDKPVKIIKKKTKPTTKMKFNVSAAEDKREIKYKSQLPHPSSLMFKAFLKIMYAIDNAGSEGLTEKGIAERTDVYTLDNRLSDLGSLQYIEWKDDKLVLSTKGEMELYYQAERGYTEDSLYYSKSKIKKRILLNEAVKKAEEEQEIDPVSKGIDYSKCLESENNRKVIEYIGNLGSYPKLDEICKGIDLPRETILDVFEELDNYSLLTIEVSRVGNPIIFMKEQLRELAYRLREKKIR